VREVVAGHGLRRLVRLVEERSAGVRRMRALALGRLALELAARELPVPQLLDAPPVHARRIDPGQLRWGAGAGRNASRTTRRTRSRVPSATGTRPPSSRRASSTRPCVRTVKNPKSARKSLGKIVLCTWKRSNARSPSG